MKRPVVLIVGAAAGALLVAAVGASAHTGFSLARLAGVHSSVSGDEASGARTESPEATDTPEAAPPAEPTEAPEPADIENVNENNDDQGETKAPATSSAEHEDGGGDHHGGGGDD